MKTIKFEIFIQQEKEHVRVTSRLEKDPSMSMMEALGYIEAGKIELLFKEGKKPEAN